MFKKSKARFLVENRLFPAIICTADSSQYLVGAEDSQGNFVTIWSKFNALHQTERPLATKSLFLAKAFLREQGIDEAIVELRSPYDEMIGLEFNNEVRSIISF